MGKDRRRNRSSSKNSIEGSSTKERTHDSKPHNKKSKKDSYAHRSRSRSNDRHRRRDHRSDKFRNRSSSSDRKLKEDRKKQERLARARALALEEEITNKREGKVGPEENRCADQSLSGTELNPIVTQSGNLNRNGNSYPGEDDNSRHLDQNSEAQFRAGQYSALPPPPPLPPGMMPPPPPPIPVDLNMQVEGFPPLPPPGLQMPPPMISFALNMALPKAPDSPPPSDNEDMQEESGPVDVELQLAKIVFQRKWKRKKIHKDSDNEMDSEDELGDVFKGFNNRPKTPEKSPEVSSDEEIDMNVEQAKDDPLEYYFNQIGSKAVKQEGYGNMTANISKQLPEDMQQEHEDEIAKHNVITLEDLQQNIVEANNPSGEEPQADAWDQKEEDEEEYTEAFVNALKADQMFVEVQETEEARDLPEAREMAEEAQALEQDEILSNSGEEDMFEVLNKFKGQNPNEREDYFEKKQKLAEKRQLKNVDHKEIQYLPFKKNFYHESEDIKELTDEQIEFYRKEMGNITVRGKDVPRPIMNWSQSGLSEKVLKTLEKNKFAHPFAIQSQALPVIMSGRDCIGIAETGSGKTLGYVLPMVRHILAQPKVQVDEGPIALVMVPTRELADQVFEDTRQMLKTANREVVCVIGGTQLQTQLSNLKKGADCVICTPGRMIEVLVKSNGKITNLERVTYVVLDEADRMFDMGFQPQISKILDNVRPDRQVVMFSATFPKNVETLARKMLKNPVEIVVGNRGQVCRNVDQKIEVLPREDKEIRLVELIEDYIQDGQILIFVQKQETGDHLFKFLMKYSFKPLIIHGGQDQIDRHNTIEEFKRGAKDIMIGTSLCARGLDIKNLILVVNFDCPTHKEDYIHRIGRTGRAGNKGTAITFVTKEEESLAEDIIVAIKISGKTPPPELVQLHEMFMVKVRRGEAKQYKNKNMIGAGYKFDAEEAMKTIEQRNTRFGSSTGGENSAQDSKAVADPEAGGLKNAKDPEKMMKDKKTQDLIKKAAAKAASEAMKNGATGSEVEFAAQKAVRAILMRIQAGEVIRQDGKMEDLIKITDELVQQETDMTGLVTQIVEINDYPEQTRRRMSDKEYIEQIERLTHTKISVRGVAIEPGRRPAIGQKKLHLYIEGDEEMDVYDAARQIQSDCEESAITLMNTEGVITDQII